MPEDLLESAPFGLYVVEAKNFTILYANGLFKERFESARIGERCFQAIFDRTAPCAHCGNGQAQMRHEFFNELDNRWYLSQPQPIIWNNQEALYVTLTDITELKNTQNRLSEAHAQMAIKNRALEEEQRLARTKQLGMITNDLLRDARFRVETLYYPSDILSGDTYSLHRTPQGGLFIYLIDGMGHGLLPSMTTFAVASVVRQSVAQEESFDQMLSRVSQTLHQALAESEQLSYIFLHLPPALDQIAYAIGGMYPVLVQTDQQLTELKANNPPFLNFMDRIEADTLSAAAIKGVLLYSDGVVEDSRLKIDPHTLRKALASDQIAPLAERIGARAQQLEDDTTLIALRRR